MNRIIEIFNQTFLHWKITLPEDSIRTHQRGVIREAGWTIRFLFDKDEAGEFLEYYAAHRMTNDRHVRIFANGSNEDLEAMNGMLLFPPDLTEEQKDKMEQEYSEKNQRINAELVKKGFFWQED